jgi:hypothetical protein
MTLHGFPTAITPSGISLTTYFTVILSTRHPFDIYIINSVGRLVIMSTQPCILVALDMFL